jgi:dTDP-3-amino-3,4,6-trideoxy-alpha-D-glucose transaminase
MHQGSWSPLAPELPFCDLQAAHAAQASTTEAALLRVARSGQYVLGPEVEGFEREFARVCAARYVVGVGSGTAALALILTAAGIGPGDEVIVPAYTAAATWMAVTEAGAKPVGAEVSVETGLIDPSAASAAVGRRTAAIVGVDLFGRLAPFAELSVVARRNGLLLVEDAAHAAGVSERAGPAGSLADAAAFSFYPTKPLGGLGDGGAVATTSEELAGAVRRLRSYGWATWQGQAAAPGGNSRLDELQAAVLRDRLERLPHAHARLSELGRLYREGLADLDDLSLPPAPPGGEPPWHQFAVLSDERDRLRAGLAAAGVGSAVHYDPIPPRLSAFSPMPDFPRAETRAGRTVSLPFDWWLSDAQALRACEAVHHSVNGKTERSSNMSSGSKSPSAKTSIAVSASQISISCQTDGSISND